MRKIMYYNINDPSVKVNLRSAVLEGITAVNGLYMPEYIPKLPAEFYKRIKEMSLTEIACEVTGAMFGEDIPAYDIRNIIGSSLNYEIPLVQLDENIFVLELFHGPTLAFKDTGARFMASLFEYLISSETKEITVLVATSGDTGSAVASAFYRRKGIKVIILYPAGRVSLIQEKMLTSLGDNITALEIDGDFDDCQRLVKQAFTDPDLKIKLKLTSANSINFARLFPQSFYYFHALARLGKRNKPVAVSVPCGNFGNLTAGVIASKMGLEIRHFIASSNSNHPVIDYLVTGKYEPSPSIPTLTNAMDVGDPSNFPRLLNLFNHNHEMLTGSIKGFWYNDSQTVEALKEIYSKYGYLADPHGAVAYLGLKEYLMNHDACGIFLESAHPAKFKAEVENATGKIVNIPESFSGILNAVKLSVRISNRFDDLKCFLLKYS